MKTKPHTPQKSDEKGAVRLRPGKEESLLRHHPWVFSGAIATLPADIEEGDIVTVTDCDGNVLGTGHFQIGSISVRILEFGIDTLPEDFYFKRLVSAYTLRRSLGLIRTDNDCFRLVHGEGDFLPGLIVDIYGDSAVMQAHSPGMHLARRAIAEALTRLPEARIRNVYYKSETTLPYKAGLDPENEYLVGSYDGNIATENGLQFNIDWLKGQKTGFFVDQRENRSLLEKFAAGRTVLNMFCYTGGFSVYAMRGGAVTVDSVDSSTKAAALTDANIALNFPDDPRPGLMLKTHSNSSPTCPATNMISSCSTRRHSPNTVARSRTDLSVTANLTPRHSRRSSRAEYCSRSPARKPSRATCSEWRSSQPPPGPGARCGYCTSSRSRPTIQSTYRIPKVNI